MGRDVNVSALRAGAREKMRKENPVPLERMYRAKIHGQWVTVKVHKAMAAEGYLRWGQFIRRGGGGAT